MKTLQTERLILREWREADAACLFEFAKNPVVRRAGCKTHESIEESLACIRWFIQSQEVWAIVCKESDKPLGWLGLHDINRHDRYREMEFVLSQQVHNRGYATEAVKRVLTYAFTELELLAVAVCHYPANVQSKRVIEKCGFTYEGTLRRYSKNGSDSLRYSMLREEWESLYGGSSALPFSLL